VAGSGRRCPGLPEARLAIAGEGSPVLTTVRSAVVPCAWLWTARPASAVLLGAMLPIDRWRAALRSTAGKLARASSRRPGRERPGGWCGLRAAHDRTLRPPAGGRHGLPARSVAIGATATRSRSPGGLSCETWPAAESTGSGSGTGRDGTAAQVVVTRNPAKPRTPIPRTFVTRQASIASWADAPAGPGVGISPAFVIRPVFGARPPTPAPSPREPCHTIDRRHPGDR
jgi:hypothetical protein